MEDVSLNDVVKSPALFAGWTMDARFLSGDWEIVGNVHPTGEFVFPTYKVGISGQTWVVDVEGNPLRIATGEEAASLSFKSSHSPIAFEKAFRAYHREQAWEPRFERMLVRPWGNRSH
jgi:hypothetical protein